MFMAFYHTQIEFIRFDFVNLVKSFGNIDDGIWTIISRKNV